MTNGAETAANSLMTTLVSGETFSVPVPNLNDPKFAIPAAGADPFTSQTKLTNADLTSGQVDGSGTFDALMKGFAAHLKEQYDKGRITGEQYTKAYIELTAGAMANAVQFLLGRDQAYWQAVTAQLQAQLAQVQMVTARVELEKAKAALQAQHWEALANAASFALTKIKLANEDASFAVTNYNLSTLMPAQKALLDKQLVLTQEQTEAQRAQTADTRTDGASVTGVLGKQKELYSQQITSYQRDSEVKAAKLFTDAWITMKTIDEGVLPPSGFANTSLDTILTKLKSNNGLT